VEACGPEAENQGYQESRLCDDEQQLVERELEHGLVRIDNQECSIQPRARTDRLAHRRWWFLATSRVAGRWRPIR
jgi:hypothetical protein